MTFGKRFNSGIVVSIPYRGAQLCSPLTPRFMLHSAKVPLNNRIRRPALRSNCIGAICHIARTPSECRPRDPRATLPRLRQRNSCLAACWNCVESIVHAAFLPLPLYGGRGPGGGGLRPQIKQGRGGDSPAEIPCQCRQATPTPRHACVRKKFSVGHPCPDRIRHPAPVNPTLDPMCPTPFANLSRPAAMRRVARARGLLREFTDGSLGTGIPGEDRSFATREETWNDSPTTR